VRWLCKDVRCRFAVSLIETALEVALEAFLTRPAGNTIPERYRPGLGPLWHVRTCACVHHGWPIGDVVRRLFICLVDRVPYFIERWSRLSASRRTTQQECNREYR